MTLTTVQTVSEGPPVEAGAPPGQAIEGRSPLRLALARLRSDRVALLSAGMIVFVALLAICAPLIEAVTGHNAIASNIATGTDITGQPLGPGVGGFLLGTDNLGRDILVRIAYGAQISLLVGVLATILATVVGTVVGMLAGYFGGWIDAILARMMDTVLAFPYLLLALALGSVAAEPGSRLHAIAGIPLTILVIAFFSWAAIGRIVRGQTLSQKEKEYVEAAHAMGAGNLRILFIDILPNLVAPVIVLGTLLIPTAIVFESSLSFLGVGVPPPKPSWGNMLSDAQTSGFQAWWFWIFPSLALLITTLGFNLLGDSVRDALDPRTERIFAMRRKARFVGGAAASGEAAAGKPDGEVEAG
ncbi:MAG TPA: ABC transporter permease [Candidatus Binatia bacterium]|nr:ABC transporter permease [Candidatus Binatia bacterium]